MRDNLLKLKLEVYNHFVLYGILPGHEALAKTLAETLTVLTKTAEKLEELETDSRYWQQVATRGYQS